MCGHSEFALPQIQNEARCALPQSLRDRPSEREPVIASLREGGGTSVPEGVPRAGSS